MRIIAGSAGGVRIEAPEGLDTRPTLDKIKESLFNILAFQLEGRQVLDLFAGSGALGLEAVSRGASHATLCDMNRHPIEVIGRNVKKLRFEDFVTVERGDWQLCLTKLQAKGAQFDLVFLDPPYRMTNTGEMMGRLKELNLLCDGALIVTEHGAKTPPVLPEGFTQTDVRDYRETAITFATFSQGG